MKACSGKDASQLITRLWMCACVESVSKGMPVHGYLSQYASPDPSGLAG